jgi:hypothetical protein
MPNKITKRKLVAAKKAAQNKRAADARRTDLDNMRARLARDLADGAPVPDLKVSVRERLFLKKLKKTQE